MGTKGSPPRKAVCSASAKLAAWITHSGAELRRASIGVGDPDKPRPVKHFSPRQDGGDMEVGPIMEQSFYW